jgi:hypothetical protein
MRSPSPVGVNFSSVTYGNGKFLAVGDYGRILTSLDGITWTVSNSDTTYWYSSVTYANGQFVAVGNQMVTTGMGTYIAVLGASFTSTDGTTWSQKHLMGSFYFTPLSVTYGNGQYVAVGGDSVFTSSDGATWAIKYSGTTNNLTSVTYGNNQFIAIGDSGTVLTSSNGRYGQ